MSRPKPQCLNHARRKQERSIHTGIGMQVMAKEPPKARVREEPELLNPEVLVTPTFRLQRP